jgi:hypothetical protein
MEMAQQRGDFMDAKIGAVLDQCNLFFDAWVDLHGLPGMTNYFNEIVDFRLCALAWKVISSLHSSGLFG